MKNETVSLMLIVMLLVGFTVITVLASHETEDLKRQNEQLRVLNAIYLKGLRCPSPTPEVWCGKPIE
jgi:hypothetical protein